MDFSLFPALACFSAKNFILLFESHPLEKASALYQFGIHLSSDKSFPKENFLQKAFEKSHARCCGFYHKKLYLFRKEFKIYN